MIVSKTHRFVGNADRRRDPYKRERAQWEYGEDFPN